MTKSVLNILFCLLIFSSCGQNFNSNSNDQGQYATVKIDTSSPAGERFAAAYKVIQVNCMACHSWNSYDTSDKWIQSGYVIQADYSHSLLMTRLKNNGGDMPKSPNGALKTSEITILQDWITNL